MRVVALFVVVCGCRAAASSAVDATIPLGDGLPERIVTDAALWSDLPTFEVSAPDRTADARSMDGAETSSGDVPTDQAGVLDADTGQDCPLLGGTCVGKEVCYPFPYEGTPDGRTRCSSPQGVGEASVPCQSQLDCDGTALCSAPGQPDSTCMKRCDLSNPQCPTRMQCTPFFSYVGVGVCL